LVEYSIRIETASTWKTETSAETVLQDCAWSRAIRKSKPFKTFNQICLCVLNEVALAQAILHIAILFSVAWSVVCHTRALGWTDGLTWRLAGTFRGPVVFDSKERGDLWVEPQQKLAIVYLWFTRGQHRSSISRHTILLRWLVWTVLRINRYTYG